jgi:hypothetical protein
LTKVAAGEARKQTASAMSAGVPIRPRGTVAATRATVAGSPYWVATSSVSIIPADTQFTRTFGPHSRARVWLRFSSPAFAAP